VNLVYAVSACVAIAATVMVITNRNAVHALLYLVVSLLAVAVIMFLLGAAFVAALEVIIYAGAIMVLFVFVIMLIGPRNDVVNPRTWIGPAIMSVILLAELAYVVTGGAAGGSAGGAPSPLAVKEVTPRQVGIALLGPYLIGVEVTAFLLLAGLVGAFHLGRRLVVALGRKEA
jgi:NADH-quinone oxidoreductase subunit J